MSVVFITGSSIGIGRETAYWFAKDNWDVVITYYKNKEEAERTEKKCRDLGAKEVLVLNLNLKDNESVDKVVENAIEKFGKIDVLVNNAGVVYSKELEEQTDEEIEDQLRTNLEGLIKITKRLIPFIKDSIINVSSGAGKRGFGGLSVYSATKFGVRGFTQSLAEELEGVNVFSVNPGSTATKMTNFKGVPADKVGEIIYNAATGEYDIHSGGDIDVWDLLQ
ncbi:MAG: SDR family oxidoreductase [Nanoarchaeota archaeon]|nr:SDR family oxidoreductase [Nanoarchaeota archaeon]